MIVIGKDADKAEKIIIKSFIEKLTISKSKLGSMYIILPGTYDHFRSIIEDDEAFMKKIKEIQDDTYKYESVISFDTKITIANHNFSKVLGRITNHYKALSDVTENVEKCLFDKKFAEGHDDIILEKEMFIADFDNIQYIHDLNNNRETETKKRFLVNQLFRFDPEKHKSTSDTIQKPCEILGLSFIFSDGRRHMYYCLKSVNFRKISYLINLLFH